MEKIILVLGQGVPSLNELYSNLIFLSPIESNAR